MSETPIHDEAELNQDADASQDDALIEPTDNAGEPEAGDVPQEPDAVPDDDDDADEPDE